MVGLAELMLGLLSLYGLSGLYIWRETRSLWSNYGDDFDDMKTYRASQFRRELHDIVMGVLGQVDYEDLADADEPSVPVMDAMEHVDRDSLQDVEDALRHYDEPNELIDEAETSYDTALRNLGMAAVAAAVIAAAAALLQPGDLAFAIEGLATIPLAVGSLNALDHGYSGYKSEQKVDRAIRNYRDDY